MLPDDAKPRVFVHVPTEGNVHWSVCMELLRIKSDPRFYGHVSFVVGKPVEHNMNRAAKAFLESDFDYDYFINIDADNPPMLSPLDLVFLDLDIVGLPTPVWFGTPDYKPWWLNAMDKHPTGQGFNPHTQTTMHGLEQVDALGLGCTVIARRVLEAIKAPFNRVWDEDGIMDTGLDFAFCQRAKAAGFKIWAHYGYICRHYKELEICQVVTQCRKVMGMQEWREKEKLLHDRLGERNEAIEVEAGVDQ